MRANDHLSSADLAAFVGGELRDEARTAAEAHLSTCRACRRGLITEHASTVTPPDIPLVPMAVREQVRRLVPIEMPRPQPIEQARPLWPSLLAAAIVVAALTGWAVFRDGRQTLSPSDRVVRSGAALLFAPTLIEPADGARVPAAARQFRWSPVPDVVGYIVTVLDEGGDIVHEATVHPTTAHETDTAETPLQAELDLRLLPGTPRPSASYYWFVCAQQTDGNEWCSSISQFVIE